MKCSTTTFVLVMSIIILAFRAIYAYRRKEHNNGNSTSGNRRWTYYLLPGIYLAGSIAAVILFYAAVPLAKKAAWYIGAGIAITLATWAYFLVTGYKQKKNKAG